MDRFRRFCYQRRRGQRNFAAEKVVQTKQIQSEKAMKMSNEGSSLLRAIEEYREFPYDDQTGEDIENWVPGATVGFGHLIKGSKWPEFRGRGVGLLEANTLFAEDLAPFELCVMGAIDDAYQLSENKFDALVFLAYNIGQGAFRRSSVVKMVNDQWAETSYDTLEDAWMAWNRSQGRVMNGLINRRAAEWKIYCNGIYERW